VSISGEIRTGKSDDAARLLRAVRRIAARVAREVPTNAPGDAALMGSTATPEVAAEPRAPKPARPTGKVPARAEPREVAEPQVAAASAETAAITTAAQDVLAVLAAETMARPEPAAASPEVATLVRSALAPGERPRARGGAPEARGKGAIDAAGMAPGMAPGLADAAEEIIQPVRVVRQETHFQPAGIEALRWQNVQRAEAAAGEAPAMPLPASEAKAVPLQPAARERGAAAVASSPPPDAAMPAAQPVTISGEIAPGAVGFQIADRVQQALSAPSEPGAPAPAAGGNAEPETRQTFAPALRTIKLQLNPAALGAVTIVLSGTDEGLRVHLTAELADTASVVENDRAALSARLAGAGYSATEITVARMAGQGMDGDMRDSSPRQGATQDQFAGNSAREGAAQTAGQQAGRGFGDRQPSRTLEPGPARDAAAAPLVAGVSYAGRFRPI
jgi:flagellar hook-length control protein FliK